jgi:hypothetical protein
VLGIAPWIPYTEIFAPLLPGPAQPGFEGGAAATLFPVRTFAALVGLALLPLVSRWTARWDPPLPIPQPQQGQS